MPSFDSSVPSALLPGLQDAVVLITGSTKGTGRATAEMFAQCGSKLVINGRSAGDTTSVAGEIAQRYQCNCLPLAADISDPKQVDDLFAALSDWSAGKLDVLVCNAGYPLIDELWETPLHEMGSIEVDQWFRQVREVDVDGARYCSRHALRMMVPLRRGALVFVSSTPAIAGYRRGMPYTEAKAAVLGLMRDIAVKYAKFGVRANAVAPGNIKSGWYRELTEEQRSHLANETPMGRWGTPEEVAGTIVFLASSLAGYITGQTIIVDGGEVIR